MRLLILTQAVDKDDPVLGFMHRWIEKFSERFESITVICLKRGRHSLPSNVEILSLGKEEGVSVVRYIARFYKYIFQKRNSYDAVVVHMNEEYVLLGGLLWKIWGKHVYLWRNHLMGSWRTRLAGRWSHKVFYTSPQSYTASFENALQMPVGIDTERFAYGAGERDGVLMLGRVDPIKRVKEMLDTAIDAAREQRFKLILAGSPSPGAEAYAEGVQERLKDFVGEVTYLKGIPHAETPRYFQSTDIVLNFTPSGSFDKVIFEAASCGALILVTNEGLRGSIPEACLTDITNSKEALLKLLTLSEEEKIILRQKLRGWVEQEHSLNGLLNSLHTVIVG